MVWGRLSLVDQILSSPGIHAQRDSGTNPKNIRAICRQKRRGCSISANGPRIFLVTLCFLFWFTTIRYGREISILTIFGKCLKHETTSPNIPKIQLLKLRFPEWTVWWCLPQSWDFACGNKHRSLLHGPLISMGNNHYSNYLFFGNGTMRSSRRKKEPGFWPLLHYKIDEKHLLSSLAPLSNNKYVQPRGTTWNSAIMYIKGSFHKASCFTKGS